MKVTYMVQGINDTWVIEDVLDVTYEDKYIQIWCEQDGKRFKTILPYQSLLLLTIMYDDKEDEK